MTLFASYKTKKYKLGWLALASKWQNERKTDLAEFVSNRGPKTVSETETAKELNEAQERLKRESKSRVKLPEESAASFCVDGCSGQWISAASEILVNNGIGLKSFWSAIFNALKHGGENIGMYIFMVQLIEVKHSISTQAKMNTNASRIRQLKRLPGLGSRMQRWFG